MSFEQNYGTHDPEIDIEYNDEDQWIEEQIVYNGELTGYGEELYESTKTRVYDELQGEWIYV